MMTPSTIPLRALAGKSAAWYGATRLWAQVISWGISIVLARWLTPNDYGLFAMALSVLAFVELLQEFGLGTAIVQRQHLTHPQLNAVFWVIVLGSVGLAVCAAAAAGLIADAYGEPRLTWILRLLTLNFLLNAVGAVPYSLLTKAIDLRRRSMAEASGVTVAALTAIGLAYLDWGVWALVIGHVARAVVLNVMLAVFAQWCPGFKVAKDGLSSMMAFSLRITGTQLLGAVSGGINTIILARFLGAHPLGLYAMAQSIADGPHRVSSGIINQLSLPIFSRFQNDTAVLRSHYLRISKYLVVVAFPAQAGVALVASDLVPVLLSSKWEAIILPLQIMCVEYMMWLMTLSSGPLLTARGRADVLLRRSALSAVAMTGVTMIAAPFGLLAVVIARLVVMLPLRLMLLVPALRELGLPVTAYLGSMSSCLLATGVMTVAVLFVQHTLPFAAGSVKLLVASVLVGASTYPLALLILDRGLGAEVRTIASDIISTSKSQVQQ
jgi:O-antigen/teichoic acid export membrane protein